MKSVRDRYQGYNRNPWNEIECGSNYARSMASFALLPILSGFTFDLPHGTIGFDPVVAKDNFRCIWSLGTGWGNVKITEAETVIQVLHGSLQLASVRLPYMTQPKKLLIDGKEIAFNWKDGVLSFEKIEVTKSIHVV